MTVVKSSPSDPWVEKHCSEQKQHNFVETQDLRGCLNLSPETKALQRPGSGSGVRGFRLGVRWSNRRGDTKRTEADPSGMKGQDNWRQGLLYEEIRL